MEKILVILGGGRVNGNTAQLVDAFMKGTAEAGHYAERISFEQAVSYYNFTIINDIGFHDKGILLAGGAVTQTGNHI